MPQAAYFQTGVQSLHKLSVPRLSLPFCVWADVLRLWTACPPLSLTARTLALSVQNDLRTGRCSGRRTGPMAMAHSLAHRFLGLERVIRRTRGLKTEHKSQCARIVLKHLKLCCNLARQDLQVE